MLYYIMGIFTVRKSSVRLLILAFFYVVYLVIGASIFSAVEGPEERAKVKMLRHYREKFLKDNRRCLTGNLPMSRPIRFVKYCGPIDKSYHKPAVTVCAEHRYLATGRRYFSRRLYQQYASWSSDRPSDSIMPCRDWCRRSVCRLFALMIFIVCYMIFGALVFIGLEGAQEDVLKRQIRVVRQLFMNSVNGCVTDAELESFIVEIVNANNRGVSAIRNVTSEPNWSFGQAFFFAGTVLTTIGYGHVTPLSEGGKVFCIIYAIIGIPLTLIMFSALVERLMIPTTLILEYMQKKMGHLYQTLHIKLLHFGGVLLTLLVIVFLIPATVFYSLEPGWNYLDAFYYSFISMTTIGLGDYIPGDNPDQRNRALYKILTTFYLFMGLILMMVMLAHLHRIPELNVGFHFYLMSDEGSDEERARLRPSEKVGSYTEQRDEPDTSESYQINDTADDQTQLTAK